MNHRKMPPRMLDFVCSRRQWIVALLQQVLLELLELFELLELLELLDLLKLLELSKLLELLKLPKLVLQLLLHTPARAARRATGAMTCCCAKPARFLLWDPTSTHDLATEDHMQRLNARRTENSEGWAVRAHIGASPLLQKQSKFSSALTEVRLICGSAGHVLEPVWENFLRNLIGTPATLNNQALLLPQCTVAGWSNLTCAPLRSACA